MPPAKNALGSVSRGLSVWQGLARASLETYPIVVAMIPNAPGS